MLAATIVPGQPGESRLSEVADPATDDGPVLVDGVLVGICATDAEVIKDGFGRTPAGRPFMVGFHESLGRVREAPTGSGLAVGDLVAGIVRAPCSRPDCMPCRHGEWDYCATGDYTERGIVRRDGFGSQQWRTEPEYAVRLDPALDRLGVLTEPTSVVSKAWRQIDAIGTRSTVAPETVLVTGAGPIGLLAAMIGVRRGLDVHVVDVVTDGPKPQLVRDLGATYHSDGVSDLPFRADVVIEASGVQRVAGQAILGSARNSISCLIGLSGPAGGTLFDARQFMGGLISGNRAVVGTVNSGRPDWESAAAELAAADPAWLERLITRTVPLTTWPDALRRRSDDVKIVVDIAR